mgnify:FL=1
MAKNLRKPKTGVKNPAAAALLLSFGCGVGVCILLLALAAFLLTHTGLPLSAVRPMACMAAAVGAAVSAAVLARRLQKRLLLCGLGCGTSGHPAGYFRRGKAGHHCFRPDCLPARGRASKE